MTAALRAFSQPQACVGPQAPALRLLAARVLLRAPLRLPPEVHAGDPPERAAPTLDRLREPLPMLPRHGHVRTIQVTLIFLSCPGGVGVEVALSVVVVLVRGKELRKLVIIALLQVFTEGKHILYAHPTPQPHSLPVNSALLRIICALSPPHTHSAAPLSRLESCPDVAGGGGAVTCGICGFFPTWASASGASRTTCSPTPSRRRSAGGLQRCSSVGSGGGRSRRCPTSAARSPSASGPSRSSANPPTPQALLSQTFLAVRRNPGLVACARPACA